MFGLKLYQTEKGLHFIQEAHLGHSIFTLDYYKLTIIYYIKILLVMEYYFNHESPLRGETFVIFKVVKGLVNIKSKKTKNINS